MEIKKAKLCGKTRAEIETEIKFHIASARITKPDLVEIYFDENCLSIKDKRISAIESILKEQKKSRKIQLFVATANLLNQSTETEYLFNKYPDLQHIGLCESSYIVKV